MLHRLRRAMVRPGRPLERRGHTHQVTFLRGKKKTPSELMPRVHQVVSLLKRWLIETHQGAVSHKCLDYYLDEFTFRFNRRRSKVEASSSFAWISKRWPSILSPITGSSTHTQLGLPESRTYPPFSIVITTRKYPTLSSRKR